MSFVFLYRDPVATLKSFLKLATEAAIDALGLVGHLPVLNNYFPDPAIRYLDATVYLSFCLSVCLSLFLSVCLSVCLSLSLSPHSHILERSSSSQRKN